MVYRGPSQGCLVCRQRRVKCDLEVPACGNCRKRRVHCPGPKDAFDKMLRDQTSTLQRQSSDQQPQSKTQKKTDTASGTQCKRNRPVGNKSLEPLRSVSARIGQSWPSTSIIPKIEPLKVDPEYEGLCLLFSTMRTSDRTKTEVGFIEHLMPLYYESPPNSPLSLATSAVATNVLYQRKYQKADPFISRSFYARSVVETQAAILDPVHSQSDALLATVLMLDFYETLTALFTQTSPSHKHYEGAVALVNHRKAKNYANKRARLLLMAVRMRMLSAPPGKHQGRRDELLYDDVPLMSVESAAEFQRLRSGVDGLLSYANQSLIVDDTQLKSALIDTLSYQATKLNAELKTWKRDLPSSWEPKSIPAIYPVQSPAATEAGNVHIEVYSHAQMANIINSYNRMRIAVLEIVQKCNAAVEEGTEQSETFVSHIKSELDTLRCSLLNSPENPDALRGKPGEGVKINAMQRPTSSSLATGVWPELGSLAQEPLSRTWAHETSMD